MEKVELDSASKTEREPGKTVITRPAITVPKSGRLMMHVYMFQYLQDHTLLGIVMRQAVNICTRRDTTIIVYESQ
jgi:hypothetical protein